MKSSVIALAGLAVVVTAGTLVYVNHQKAPPVPAPVVESPATPAEPAPPEKIAAPKPEPPRTISANAGEPIKVSAATPVVSETKPDDSASPIHKAVDALLSPTAGHQKQAMFDQFRTNGQIDQVMTELKRRATENPNDPEIPTTLGEAMLNKVRLLHESGADVNEMGILAMQADQSFNAALKLDPSNWEAQFVKYSTMFYWPAEPKRDNEAAQKLAGLIDQQETLPSQPHFAQTYIALGNQYQKSGQPDKAQATWQLGLQKFPSDPALLKKLTAQP